MILSDRWSEHWTEMWQNLIPRERKSITMFWVTSGIWGPNSKTVVFPHLWISSGELSKHVNEMPEGPCWIFDEAGPLLKNSNSIPVFICCGYIHPTISSDVQDQSGWFSFFEARSLFCVTVTSDIEMQASLRRIRVRNESHYLHEHTVIVQQSSTEKCNYATFNSRRAAVESSGDNFKCYACMSCKEFFCIILYNCSRSTFIWLIKVIFSETFSISQAVCLLFIASLPFNDSLKAYN